MNVLEIAPVVKTIDVRRSAADAFRIFTAEMGAWWPLGTHALSPENGTKAVAVIVEPRVGGRVIERGEDGREFHWGDVLAYEPGRRFVMTWRLGRAREKSGEVEVVFSSLDNVSCRVTLTHSGWDRMEDGGRLREGYNMGWIGVFEHAYAQHCSRM
jgi:uncharacterized protein YndB with AHSA1/START domain